MIFFHVAMYLNFFFCVGLRVRSMLDMLGILGMLKILGMLVVTARTVLSRVDAIAAMPAMGTDISLCRHLPHLPGMEEVLREGWL